MPKRSVSNLARIPEFLLVALVVSSCAHTREAGRSIAGEAVRVSSESSVNARGEAGAYTIDFEGTYPIDAQRTFASTAEYFRGVNASTFISNALSPHKDRPLNKLRVSARFAKARPGYDLAYVINGFPDGHPGWGEESKVDCRDKYDATPGRGAWHQECDPDFAYEKTRKYMSKFSQISDCTESGAATVCRFEISGVMEPITMPFLKKAILSLLFGASEYSATQAAHLSVQSQLHSLYAASELLKGPPPYTAAAAKAAVDRYVASSEYARVGAFKAKFPAKMTDTASVVFAPKN